MRVERHKSKAVEDAKPISHLDAMDTLPDENVQYPIVIGESMYSQDLGLHTLKYEFKPKSVDPRKLGEMNISASGSTTVHLSTETRSTEQFQGKRNKSKQTECVLIFDPERECFVLEKLSTAVMNLRHRPKSSSHVIVPPNVYGESIVVISCL